MTANVGNTDSSQRLQRPPDGVPQTAPKKATGSAAPGVSGDGTSAAGTAPPAPPVSSETLTVSLAPVSSVSYDPDTLRASAARLADAAAGNPVAGYVVDLAAIDLTPLAALRALFRAVMQSNKNQQDNALEKSNRKMEIAKADHEAAAAKDKDAADRQSDAGLRSFVFTCGAACATVAADSKWGGDKHTFFDSVSNKAVFDGASKGFDGLAAKTTSDAKADEKLSDAQVSLVQADADEANKQRAGADAALDAYREQLKQMMRAIAEIGESEANLKRMA
jgi:hypothetical protein